MSPESRHAKNVIVPLGRPGSPPRKAPAMSMFTQPPFVDAPPPQESSNSELERGSLSQMDAQRTLRKAADRLFVALDQPMKKTAHNDSDGVHMVDAIAKRMSTPQAASRPPAPRRPQSSVTCWSPLSSPLLSSPGDHKELSGDELNKKFAGIVQATEELRQTHENVGAKSKGPGNGPERRQLEQAYRKAVGERNEIAAELAEVRNTVSSTVEADDVNYKDREVEILFLEDKHLREMDSLRAEYEQKLTTEKEANRRDTTEAMANKDAIDIEALKTELKKKSTNSLEAECDVHAQNDTIIALRKQNENAAAEHTAELAAAWAEGAAQHTAELAAQSKELEEKSNRAQEELMSDLDRLRKENSEMKQSVSRLGEDLEEKIGQTKMMSGFQLLTRCLLTWMQGQVRGAVFSFAVNFRDEKLRKLKGQLRQVKVEEKKIADAEIETLRSELQDKAVAHANVVKDLEKSQEEIRANDKRQTDLQNELNKLESELAKKEERNQALREAQEKWKADFEVAWILLEETTDSIDKAEVAQKHAVDAHTAAEKLRCKEDVAKKDLDCIKVRVRDFVKVLEMVEDEVNRMRKAGDKPGSAKLQVMLDSLDDSMMAVKKGMKSAMDSVKAAPEETKKGREEADKLQQGADKAQNKVASNIEKLRSIKRLNQKGGGKAT